MKEIFHRCCGEDAKEKGMSFSNKMEREPLRVSIAETGKPVNRFGGHKRKTGFDVSATPGCHCIGKLVIKRPKNHSVGAQ